MRVLMSLMTFFNLSLLFPMHFSSTCEYAFVCQNEKHLQFDMKHPLGSVERFMEILNIIIKANGSMKLFREKHIDMTKAAPMIGTIMLGLQRQRIYHNPFRIYSLDNFDEDWNLFIKETAFKGLRKWGDDMGTIYCST